MSIGVQTILSNGDEIARFNATLGTEVNFFDLTASPTGVALILAAVGDDANIDFTINAKGTGVLRFGGKIVNPEAMIQTLTDVATIEWNMALGQMAQVTLAGNRTLNLPTNYKAGTYILKVTQDATGGRTLAFHSAFNFTGNITPQLMPAANSVDIFMFINWGAAAFDGSFLPDSR